MVALCRSNKDDKIYIQPQCKITREQNHESSDLTRSQQQYNKLDDRSRNDNHSPSNCNKYYTLKCPNSQQKTQTVFNITSRNSRVIVTQITLLMFVTLGIEIKAEPCLTGNFVDVQNWVSEDGKLNPDLDPKEIMDLSSNPFAVDQLRLMMNFEMGSTGVHTKTTSEESRIIISSENLEKVVYLSLSSNNLYRIPLFYSSSYGTSIFDFLHLHFLSFYGNSFGYSTKGQERTAVTINTNINVTDFQEDEINPRKASNAKSNWASDLQHVRMANLLELDLRKCGIQSIENDTFARLRNLRRLYLSHNRIQIVYGNAFQNLTNLVHLDLSHNEIVNYNFRFILPPSPTTEPSDLILLEKGVFEPLKRLKSLDLSYSKIMPSSANRFSELTESFKRLSICYTKFPSISAGFFSKTSLRFIDISANIALEALKSDSFQGIEDNLIVLNANRLGIKNTDWITNLTKVKVLSLNDNDIVYLDARHFNNLVNLEILDLMNNRISNWNIPIFHNINHIEMLRLGGNNLNLMTPTMLDDFSKVKFLGIAKNKFVCNCDLKNFVQKGRQNTQLVQPLDIYLSWNDPETYNNTDITHTKTSENIYYLNVRRYYETVIANRINVSFTEEKDTRYSVFGNVLSLTREVTQNNHSTIFLDYLDEKYICIDSRTTDASAFDNVICDEPHEYSQNVETSTLLIVMLIMMAVVIVIIILVFWKWWYIRYFIMLIKNAAILSIMGNGKESDDEEKVFTYDVFVSYCEEDRKWVLEHLLPEVEQTTPISICLHERDFQVGLSILENIISSMDRSRVLMMVVSNQFLMSQWCQFEMHLAQHRLLETRREQLILVLLEDIPRRKRPNTLHYLMMTKTYIVWPGKKVSEQPEFWKRLKKALMYGKSFDRHSTA